MCVTRFAKFYMLRYLESVDFTWVFLVHMRRRERRSDGALLRLEIRDL